MFVTNVGRTKVSEYRKIGIRLWRSEKFKKVDLTAKLMYVYFLTNPHSNTIGLYEIPPLYIPLDTDLKNGAINRAIKDLCEIGLISFDHKNDLILVERWLDHSPITNKKHCMGAITKVLNIATSPLKTQRIQELIVETDRFNGLNTKLKDFLKHSPIIPLSDDSPMIAYPHDKDNDNDNGDIEYPPTEPPLKSKRGTRWKEQPLPEEWYEWTREKFGWTEERAINQFMIFTDYWIAKPGRGGIKLDWFATWRNWCRKENAMSGGGDDKTVKGILSR